MLLGMSGGGGGAVPDSSGGGSGAGSHHAPSVSHTPFGKSSSRRGEGRWYTLPLLQRTRERGGGVICSLLECFDRCASRSDERVEGDQGGLCVGRAVVQGSSRRVQKEIEEARLLGKDPGLDAFYFVTPTTVQAGTRRNGIYVPTVVQFVFCTTSLFLVRPPALHMYSFLCRRTTRMARLNLDPEISTLQNCSSYNSQALSPAISWLLSG